jgi:tetratricopeptide (TPR) repeat protein
MTRWEIYEYLLKGLYLGLWVFLALQVPQEEADLWVKIVWTTSWMVIAFVVVFLLASLWQVIRGIRPWRNWLAFPIFVLLESPTFIYTGILMGVVISVYSGNPAAEGWVGPLVERLGSSFEDIRHSFPSSEWLSYCIAGGLLLGYGFYRLRQTEEPRWRLWLGLVLAAALAYVAVAFLQRLEALDSPWSRWYLGIHLMLGIPFFYILSFCGEAEESEVEIMALCATLGASLHLLGFGQQIPGMGGATSFLVPLLIYYVYAVFLLPPLRVFKHVLRGYSYMHIGQLRVALGFFRRALKLDPRSRWALEGMIRLHRRLTPAVIAADAELARVVDYGLCLDRAGALLMHPPTAEQMREAEDFLALVEQKQPRLQARVDYLRTLADLHRKDYEAAAARLARLLDPSAGYDPAVRQEVLFEAWELALRLHPRMAEVGQAALRQPGRRMEAIAAVERRLRREPQNEAARQLKRELYAELTESEFIAAVSPEGEVPKDFDYELTAQLGQALLEDADRQRRERGRELLRIAARGWSGRAVGLYVQLADSYEKEGEADNAQRALTMACQVAQQVGPRRLSEEQYRQYLAVLQRLAQEAERRQDYARAISYWRRYLEDGGTAALETYRKLAELYGQIGDPLNGLLMVETALAYDKSDADLLRKKDTFYYSLDIKRLEEVREKVAPWFDVDYCVRKATAVLNAPQASVELLDWAGHLAELAALMRPQSNAVRLVQARVLLRRGQREEGLKLLEDIHYESEKGSGAEEEAWYLATKLLGQLYLEELNRPENALHCYLQYKEYYKSGADTLFQIARCYEALGDRVRAMQHYKAVTGFEGHPLVWEAEAALRRLQEGGQ